MNEPSASEVSSLLNNSEVVDTRLDQSHSNNLRAIPTTNNYNIHLFLDRIALEAWFNPRIFQICESRGLQSVDVSHAVSTCSLTVRQ
jgi:hypothetical protein